MSIVQSGLPLALSMPFILATWTAFLHRRRTATNLGVTPDITSVLGPDDPLDAGAAAAAVDLETALREVVASVDSAARLRWVRIELAVAMPMAVPTNPRLLRTALRDTMLTAIGAASGGQVLVTAATFSNQLHIGITDDGRATDQQIRETVMSDTEALLALHGGSIAVAARPGRGTTVTIRLPIPASAERAAGSPVQLPVLASRAA